MSINIYTVTNHLSSEGWELISDSYKNLTSELEMKCPKGHLQKQSYGDWRKHKICDICLAGDPYKIKRKNVPIKQENVYRILALDAASNITGYAIYDNEDLVNYGTFKATNESNPVARINEIKKWLINALNEWQPNFVGIEGIQLQSIGPGQYQVEIYKVLANLQGVLLDTLFENNIPYDIVYSSSWRKYCNIPTIKGRENKKKAAQDKVESWYKIECTQDEADAICIGKYFVHYLKNQISSWGEE